VPVQFLLRTVLRHGDGFQKLAFENCLWTDHVHLIVTVRFFDTAPGAVTFNELPSLG
jgi:hypothetical protein